MIVRIAATPLADADGPQLADEVLAAIAVVTRDDEDEPRARRARPRRRAPDPITQEYDG